ncbi:MAG: aldehyde ferredoxin oxidoreductase family protein [Candidatus Hodarchaeota archaeon]
MANGFFGKILWVDLSENSFKEEILPEETYRQYLGGYGLAAKLIYDNMPAKADPLGPDAILGIFPGLLTGTVAPFSGRYMIAGKSPLTGTWGDANSGGFFGPEIKKCGYDGILIKGIATTPKYITVIDDEVNIVDASEVWGLDAIETEDKLREKHGTVQLACIGHSSEKLSLISGIVNDKGRIAARSGFGATMGSKKLKAIVLKGNKKIPLSDEDSLRNHTKDYNNRVAETKGGIISIFKTYGTTAGNVFSGSSGDTPVKNWAGSSIEDFPTNRLNKISAGEIDKYKQKPYGCFACPLRCGAIMKIPELNIEESHRPEYETCAAFGPLLLNDDLMSIFDLNEICNRAGLDTISAGGTVAFAIECFENGLINKDDTDGLELTWGNSVEIIKLVKKMINREGFGDILADGCKRASERIGKGSEQYAITSLGQELGMHDSKFMSSLGLAFAFDPTPGRHTTPNVDMVAMGPIGRNELIDGFIIPKNFRQMGDDRFKALMLVNTLAQFSNSLGLCMFSNMISNYPMMELIKAATGWDISVEELIKTGLRIQTLRQAFTIREGVILAENELPGRAIGNPPFESGPHKGKTIDYKGDYQGFCEKMGWNPKNGFPLKESLADLNLDFVIKDLYG